MHNTMKTAKTFLKQRVLLIKFVILAVLISMTALFQSCQENNPNEPSAMSEDEYLRTVAVNSSYSGNTDDEDNLVAEDLAGMQYRALPVPYDSIIGWRRIVTGVTTNAIITFNSDTMKTVEATRNITGNFIILGYIAGQQDSAVKPFSQDLRRIVLFKRVNNTPNPRRNWRVFQFSATDGQTTSPQAGKDNIVMNRIEVFRNDQLVLTLNGPDFTANMFNARHFGHPGSPEFSSSAQMKVRVYLSSNQSDTDFVAFHLPRNSGVPNGIRFELVSQTPNGNNFDRIYEKTYTIQPQHGGGVFNGMISASTKASMIDNNPQFYSVTLAGMPYRVRR